MQIAQNMIPTPGVNLMKNGHAKMSVILPLPLIKSCLSVLAKKCALSTGKLPRLICEKHDKGVQDDLKCVKGHKTKNYPNQLSYIPPAPRLPS